MSYHLEGDSGQEVRDYIKCPHMDCDNGMQHVENDLGEIEFSVKCNYCDGHGTIEADTDRDQEFKYKFETEK